MNFKLIKKISSIFVYSLTTLIISCTDDSSIEPLNTPYVTFSTSDYGQISVPVDGTATVDITIYAATTSGMTLSINVDTNSVADVASYSFNSTAIIPAGSNEVTFPITLSDANLGIGVSTLVLTLDGGENVFEGESTEISYFQECVEVSGTLDFILLETIEKFVKEMRQNFNAKDILISGDFNMDRRMDENPTKSKFSKKGETRHNNFFVGILDLGFHDCLRK